MTQKELRERVRVSFAKVAEYQIVHFHAVIRLDGPNGPDTPPPPWATADLLARAVILAAGNAQVTTPCGVNRDPRESEAGRVEVHRALDWRAIQAQLSPVRHRWDLAILCHLDDTTGCRPADLLAAINSEAENHRQLSPQVLSGRLRELERSGYVRHEDLSVMPLHRLYYLPAARTGAHQRPPHRPTRFQGRSGVSLAAQVADAYVRVGASAAHLVESIWDGYTRHGDVGRCCRQPLEVGNEGIKGIWLDLRNGALLGQRLHQHADGQVGFRVHP
jgi:DNA-binding HxlR family transcriptional regulator